MIPRVDDGGGGVPGIIIARMQDNYGSAVLDQSRFATAVSELTHHHVRHLPVSVGFSSKAVEEIMLAVSDLATNLVRYARNGRIALSIPVRPVCAKVHIESRDDGPGIGDVAWAIRDDPDLTNIYRKARRCYCYSAPVEVSQAFRSPDFIPVVSQCWRCCDEPWVQVSGVT